MAHIWLLTHITVQLNSVGFLYLFSLHWALCCFILIKNYLFFHLLNFKTPSFRGKMLITLSVVNVNPYDLPCSTHSSEEPLASLLYPIYSLHNLSFSPSSFFSLVFTPTELSLVSMLSHLHATHLLLYFITPI